MSGGTFNYMQYQLDQIVDDIEDVIYYNDSQDLNEWNEKKGAGYSKETIQEFKLGIWYLKQALLYTQRIDWLIACDDGEETFHKRLHEDLERMRNINE
jgi:hypothetical protein